MPLYEYDVNVKIKALRAGATAEEALRNLLAELPGDAIVLETDTFPARVEEGEPWQPTKGEA